MAVRMSPSEKGLSAGVVKGSARRISIRFGRARIASMVDQWSLTACAAASLSIGMEMTDTVCGK